MKISPQKKKLYIKIAIAIVIVIVVTSWLTPYKSKNIPEEVYEAAATNNYYKELLEGNKKIFWVGPNCVYGKAQIERMERKFNSHSLQDNYTHVPLLIHRIEAANDAVIFFMENCGNHYCVIIPEQKIILKFKRQKEDDMFDTLVKIKDW